MIHRKLTIGFLARFSEGKGVIVDEAQKVPELFSYLQQVVDEAGQMVNLSSIDAEIGIDAKTVRPWLSVLEASFIIFFCLLILRTSKNVSLNSKNCIFAIRDWSARYLDLPQPIRFRTFT